MAVVGEELHPLMEVAVLQEELEQGELEEQQEPLVVQLEVQGLVVVEELLHMLPVVVAVVEAPVESGLEFVVAVVA